MNCLVCNSSLDDDMNVCPICWDAPFVQILTGQNGVLHALTRAGDVYRYVGTRWDEESKKTLPGFWKRLQTERKLEEVTNDKPNWMKKLQKKFGENAVTEELSGIEK